MDLVVVLNRLIFHNLKTHNKQRIGFESFSAFVQIQHESYQSYPAESEMETNAYR